MRFVYSIALLLLPFVVGGCQIPPLIAQMTANIDVSTNEIPTQNVVATINFNDVSMLSTNTQTTITFSTVDAPYSIRFILGTPSPSSQTYAMSSSHSLNGNLTLTSSTGQSIPVNIVSTNQGELIINSISINNNTINSMTGSFSVNITSGNPEETATGVLYGNISF